MILNCIERLPAKFCSSAASPGDGIRIRHGSPTVVSEPRLGSFNTSLPYCIMSLFFRSDQSTKKKIFRAWLPAAAVCGGPSPPRACARAMDSPWSRAGRAMDSPWSRAGRATASCWPGSDRALVARDAGRRWVAVRHGWALFARCLAAARGWTCDDRWPIIAAVLRDLLAAAAARRCSGDVVTADFF
ncbi:hypothetical protein F511_41874 [Dorcoceras hygrometricum]|uniref:Uncharacterized protein n=1 Tax=Dorcoceras hygrometricum TaxID=472368 RepID=A0A2Z7AW49_9LAMI|nr:hypothetical protein F511_41874 [Dorcoceras hygrometricum]